jgi:hypothetical protein
MTETTLTEEFNSEDVNISGIHVQQHPTCLSFSSLPQQEGWKISILEDLKYKSPSSIDELVKVFMDLELRWKQKFAVVPLNAVTNRKPPPGEPSRLDKSWYPHDIYDLIEHLGDDIKPRATRWLNTTGGNYDITSSGAATVVHAGNRVQTKRNIFKRIRHPVTQIDILAMGVFSTSMPELDRTLPPILNYIKLLNDKIYFDDTDGTIHNPDYRYPYASLNAIPLERILDDCVQLRRYVYQKIADMASLFVKLDREDASITQSDLRKKFNLRVLESSVVNDIPSTISVGKSASLVRSAFVAALTPNAKLNYVGSPPDLIDVVGVTDVLSLPLIGPSRLWTNDCLTRSFNYLQRNFFSHIRWAPGLVGGVIPVIPSVNVDDMGIPTRLFAELERIRPLVTVQQRNFIQSSLRYLRYFTDCRDLDTNVFDVTTGAVPNISQTPGEPVKGAGAFAINGAQGTLPFRVLQNRRFVSFFNVDPDNTNLTPSAWQHFIEFVQDFEIVSAQLTNRWSPSERNALKNLLIHMTKFERDYFIYSRRIMRQLRAMSLYPFASMYKDDNARYEDIVANVKTATPVSMVLMSKWESSVIEVINPSFITDGLRDVWSLVDVIRGFQDARESRRRWTDYVLNECGIDLEDRQQKEELIDISKNYWMYPDTTHSKLHSLLFEGDNVDVIFADTLFRILDGTVGARPWVREFYDFFHRYRDILGFGSRLLLRPSGVMANDEVFNSINGGGAVGPNWAISNIASVNQPALILTLNTDNEFLRAIANVQLNANYYDNHRIIFGFPLLHTVFTTVDVMKFIRPNTEFRVFHSISEHSDSGNPSSMVTQTWKEFIGNVVKGFHPNVTAGWIDDTNVSKDLIGELFPNMDICPVNSPNMYCRFVTRNSNNPLLTNAVNADLTPYLFGGGAPSDPVGTVNKTIPGQLGVKRPFVVHVFRVYEDYWRSKLPEVQLRIT